MPYAASLRIMIDLVLKIGLGDVAAVVPIGWAGSGEDKAIWRLTGLLPISYCPILENK